MQTLTAFASSSVLAVMLASCTDSHTSPIDADVDAPAPTCDLMRRRVTIDPIFCDTMFVQGCENWAQAMSSGTVYVQCAYEACVMADRCYGGNPANCTCGSMPACSATSACLLVAGEPRCVECTTRP
jgi:hypothetical protein